MEKIKNFQRKTMAISIKMKFMLLISKVNITDIWFSGSVQDYQVTKSLNTVNIWLNWLTTNLLQMKWLGQLWCKVMRMILSWLFSQMASSAMMVLIRLIKIESLQLLAQVDACIELLVHMIKSQEQFNKIWLLPAILTQVTASLSLM